MTKKRKGEHFKKSQYSLQRITLKPSSTDLLIYVYGMNNTLETPSQKQRTPDSISRATPAYPKHLVYAVLAIPVGHRNIVSLAPMHPITKDSITLGTQLLQVNWEQTHWKLANWKQPHPRPGMYKLVLEHLGHTKPHTAWISQDGFLSALISDDDISHQMNQLYPVQVLDFIQREFASKDPKRIISISNRLDREAKLKQFTEQ